MNLKTAAQRLGVHYQTAYKWVRSGRLVAVKVGLHYEISEAALARFEAERAAMRRVPSFVGEATGGGGRREPDDVARRTDVLQELDEMVERVTIDARGVLQLVARRAAEVVGDAAGLRLVSDDGGWLELAAFDHVDVRCSVLLGSLLAECPQRVGRGFTGRVVDTGETLYLPLVPQDQVRQMVPPQFRQYLDEVGIYSVVLAPLMVDDAVVGALGVSRDAPGQPYTEADRDFVTELATKTAGALQNARRSAQGRRARAHAQEQVDELLRAADDPASGQVRRGLVGAVQDEDDVGVAIVDLGMCFVAVGERFAELLGYAPNELVGLTWRKVTHPDDWPAEQESFRRLVAGELDFYDLASRKLRKDGSEARWLMHRSIARTPDATPHYVISVVREANTAATGRDAGDRAGDSSGSTPSR